MTGDPAEVIVTRVAAQGFYASDITDTGGFGHIFAFTFSTPGGIRVCDRVTQLSGTAADFFGFTELSFPSYEIQPWRNEKLDGKCPVPAPKPIVSLTLGDPAQMESIESALGARRGRDHRQRTSVPSRRSTTSSVRTSRTAIWTTTAPSTSRRRVAPKPPAPTPALPIRIVWSGPRYVSRGNYRVNLATGGSIQLNTSSVSGFDPVAMRGETLPDVTGTLRNFSGGSLNWTIETRCLDDLVCGSDATSQSQLACRNGPKAPVASDTACVSPRTIYDPNEASN